MEPSLYFIIAFLQAMSFKGSYSQGQIFRGRNLSLFIFSMFLHLKFDGNRQKFQTLWHDFKKPRSSLTFNTTLHISIFIILLPQHSMLL